MDVEETRAERIAREQRERYERLDAYRAQLGRGLRSSVSSIQAARDSLDELCSNELYDIELVDGTAGEDIRELLRIAERSIRAAIALAIVAAQN